MATPDIAGFRQAALKAGYKQKDIDTILDRYAARQLVQTGVTDVGELAKTDPQGALRLSQQGVKAKGSAEEQKQLGKAKDLSSSIGLLIQNYGQLEAKGPQARGKAFMSQLSSGAIAPEIADYESLRKGLIGPVARVLAGESGVLTDRDISRAENLLPKVTDDPRLVENKIRNLETLLGGKLGKDVSLTSKTAPASNKGEVLSENFIANAQFPPDGMSRSPLAALLLKGAQAAPATGGALAGILGGAIGGPAGLAGGAAVGTGAGIALKRSAEQLAGVPQPPIKERAKEIVREPSVALLESAALGVAGKGLSKILRPFKTAGEYRAAKIAEVAGKNISGDKLVKALEGARKNISPTQESAFLKFLQTAKSKYSGKVIGVDDAIKINQEANKAYTAAGKVGKSATATFNKVLGDTIKKELEVNAPKVAKANKIFSLLYKGEKNLGSVKRMAGQAAGAALIYKLLNRVGI